MELLRTFKAQIVTLRTRWIQFPFSAIRQDNLIVRVKYGFNSADHDQLHDLTLEFEYRKKNLVEEELIHKDLIKGLELLDNIVVEEYKHGKTMIHNIVAVHRGDTVVFSVDEGIAFIDKKKLEQERAAREQRIATVTTYIKGYLGDGQISKAVITDAREFKKRIAGPAWDQMPFLIRSLVKKSELGSIFDELQKLLVTVAQDQTRPIDEALTKLSQIVRQTIAPGSMGEEEQREQQPIIDVDTISHKVVSILRTQLQKLQGIGIETLRNDQKYKANVIDPLWEAMPLPLRLIGRERLQWDAICNNLRSTIFITTGDTVQINIQELQNLSSIVRKALQ